MTSKEISNIEKPTKDQEVTVKVEETKTIEKATLCKLSSRANYTIRVEHFGQSLFIPPFGSATVTKEQVTFDKNDAKFLTFIKL